MITKKNLDFYEIKKEDQPDFKPLKGHLADFLFVSLREYARAILGDAFYCDGRFWSENQRDPVSRSVFLTEDFTVILCEDDDYEIKMFRVEYHL